MRRFSVVILSCFCFFSFSAFAVANEKYFVVATPVDFAPFAFVSKDSVNPRGILVDIWKRWASATGVEIAFVTGSAPQLLAMLINGEADAHAGFPQVPQFQNDLEMLPADVFSLVSHISIFTIKGKPLYKNLAEIPGTAKIGIVSDHISVQTIQRPYAQLQIETFPSTDTMVVALDSGRIQAMLEFSEVGKFALIEQQVQADEVSVGLFRRIAPAVTMGNTETLSLLSQGFALVGKDSMQNVVTAWHTQLDNQKNVMLENRPTEFKYWLLISVALAGLGCAILGVAYYFQWKKGVYKESTFNHFLGLVRQQKNDFFCMELNLDGSFAFVEDAFAYRLGYSAATLPKKITELLSDSSYNHFFSTVSALVAKKEKTTQFSVLNKTGEELFFQCSFEPLQDRQGIYSGVLLYAYDITEIERAAHQGKAFATRLNIFLEYAPLGIFRCDLTGKVFFGNTQFNRMFAVAKTDTEITPEFPVFSEVLEGCSFLHQVDAVMFWATIKEHGLFEQKQIQLRRLDGTVFWGALSAKLVDIKYDTPFLTGFILDMTEQQAMTEQFTESLDRIRSIVEYLPDATLVLDARQRVMVWNKALEDLTGCSATTMMGKGNLEYAVPLFGTKAPLLCNQFFLLQQNYENSLAQQQQQRLTNETFMPTVNDGKGAYIWTSASALRDKDGVVIGAVQSFRDITERKLELEALEKSQQRYQMAISATDEGLWEYDLETGEHYLSPRCKDIFGFNVAVAALQDDFLIRYIYPADRKKLLTTFEKIKSGNLSRFELEMRVRHADNAWRIVLVRGVVRRNANGVLARVVGAVTDINAQKQSERAATILYQISTAVNITHDIKELFTSIHAILEKEINAKNFYVALVEPSDHSVYFSYYADEKDPQPEFYENSLVTVDSPTMRGIQSGKQTVLHKGDFEKGAFIGTASELWIGTPLVLGGRTIGIMVVQDYEDAAFYSDADQELLVSVAEQLALAIERKRNKEAMEHLAFYDQLTGLPNRIMLMDRLREALEVSKRGETPQFALFMLDLDRFKIINDSHGHSTGDDLLMEIANRLAPLVSSKDTVARLGGDEFAVLIANVESGKELIRLAKKMLEAISQPLYLGAKTIYTSSSLGIVWRTSEYTNGEEISRDADIAMYEAKQSGVGRMRIFNKNMHRKAIELMTMESDLILALQNEQFFLNYQPVYSSNGINLLGFEALVRWQHPVLGLVPPDRFISIAEDTGLIVRLGNWVMEEAMRVMAHWCIVHTHAEKIFMSINMSAKQVAQANIALRVQQIMEATQVPPKCIKMEITETAIMKDPTSALHRLHSLKKLGISLAIDDFGTGYSSLAFLQKFPVDTLKVDRSFVSHALDDADNGAIVKTIVTLAHSLKMLVVAEGVETKEQLDFIASIGGQAIQGYYFSKPLSFDDADTLVQNAVLGKIE